MDEEDYAIVSFEDGMGIVCSTWLVYEEGLLVGSLYPSNISAKELVKILLAKRPLDMENSAFYKIIEFHRFAANYESANKKLQLFEIMTDYESDEIKTADKLKKTRHSRAIKIEKDFELGNTSIKRKPLAPIENGIKSKMMAIEKPSGEIEPPEIVASEVEIKRIEAEGQPLQDPEEQQLQTEPAEETVQKVKEPEVRADKQTVHKKTQEIPNGKIDTGMIFKKLCTLEQKLNHLSNDGKERLNAFGDGDLKMFPIKTVKEMTSVEGLLESSRFIKKVISSFMSLGKCSNLNKTVANVLNHLITFEVGTKYTFKGQSANKKPAFEKLKICAVIIRALVNTGETQESIKKGIQDWLHHAKQNAQRLKALQEKRRANEILAAVESDVSSNEE
ncbi:uncharacterized protein LOC127282316 [Leptopilina boulardi]|uniref:uncharacterized protein LOC127282316 n=1 Tax=Leptopilina boulardi TaxID=63433 RepID=UPI0021F64A01|nr:uncharacterized protein LOC127282316 [Leptopilina boulardi]